MVKPLIDMVAAVCLLIALSPVFLVVTVLLAIANKGSVFFTQIRPGKHEKLFRLIKFKSMSDLTNESGELLEDEQRLTGVGKWVRKFSLDELPQLINIVKGDMSFVGPRPLLVEYLPLYNESQRKRHNVKPGITGWAQVNGRNTVEWKRRFEYDAWYVDHVSFIVDLKILFLTISKVFTAEGISSAASVTMEKFRGNE